MSTTQPNNSPDPSSRLQALGLSNEALSNAVLIGHSFTFTTTSDDPKTAYGYEWFRGTTRGLREQLAPLGWSNFADHGLEGVESPDRAMRIVTCRGNDAVGDLERNDLRTKHPRGAAAQFAIDGNVKYIEQQLFDDSAYYQQDIIPAGLSSTWYLLFDKRSDGVVAELALPASYQKAAITSLKAYPVQWAERLIIDVRPPNSGSAGARVSVSTKPGDLGDGKIEVPVERKQ